ncbi:F-box only protein 28-like isoform X1 [Leptopilina heterotoma]|uniref:F-box only protein 28-like isoform X1 n=1 Tax=Leptopilina heterotoma TaxID=63436 RepID=UPI001CA8C8F0|nr:F-box only protein 28-like isoform X1 [Leptopilina heterotoma]XP_043482171.1 F-box only protein 28-like isoform X1 [Leptopilina heterotoma]XP_043482172.1 F-box only protein 28-like isoform X1 [Leptopilina heterotoma]XP_043482173.1 F-box only protein 28-like isoform X1 [Leptopilina heterotoma]
MVSTRQSSNMGGSSAGGSVCDTVGDVQPRKQPTNIQPSTSTGLQVVESPVQCQINLLQLPEEIQDKIFSYLSFNTIAGLRPVCHQMDRKCGSLLNKTFQRLQAQMLSRFQAIKAQMPRRESARRNHPLACESDIIETLHMRLTLLQMSFGKHIERKHCCFFPGEILDEVYRILHYIKVTPKLARPYKVTDELFDLSTMAMEYFKERIEPTLPEIPYFGADFLDFAGTLSSSNTVKQPFLCLDAPLSVGGKSGSGEEGSPVHSSDEPGILESNVAPPQSNMVLRKRIRKIKQGMKRYNSQLTLMRRDLRNCKTKIAEQQKQIVEYATRLDENDKKNEETSRKFSTLLQVFTKELNKCKTELQYWRSRSPAIPVCGGCGQSIPLPIDDLQTLANQGVLPEGAFGEGFDFIPIPEGDSPIETVSPSTNATQVSTAPIEMAPPKAPISVISKRKASSDESLNDACKKPRRTAKSRQTKRSKI